MKDHAMGAIDQFLARSGAANAACASPLEGAREMVRAALTVAGRLQAALDEESLAAALTTAAMAAGRLPVGEALASLDAGVRKTAIVDALGRDTAALLTQAWRELTGVEPQDHALLTRALEALDQLGRKALDTRDHLARLSADSLRGARAVNDAVAGSATRCPGSDSV